MFTNDEPLENETHEPRFALAAFDQGDSWTTADGRTYALVDLTPAERAVVATWLRRHHRHFYLQVLLRDLIRAPSAGVPDLVFGSALDWMNGTVLIRALEQ